MKPRLFSLLLALFIFLGISLTFPGLSHTAAPPPRKPPVKVAPKKPTPPIQHLNTAEHKEKTKQPTVEETVAWMQDFLNEHAVGQSYGWTGIQPYLRQAYCSHSGDKEETRQEYQADQTTINSLNLHISNPSTLLLILNAQDKYGYNVPGESFRYSVKKTSITINLINLKSIKSIANQDFVTNDVNSPTYRGHVEKSGDSDFCRFIYTYEDTQFSIPKTFLVQIKFTPIESSKEEEIIIPFDTEESAQRFAKAFQYLKDKYNPSKVNRDLF